MCRPRPAEALPADALTISQLPSSEGDRVKLTGGQSVHVVAHRSAMSSSAVGDAPATRDQISSPGEHPRNRYEQPPQRPRSMLDSRLSRRNPVLRYPTREYQPDRASRTRQDRRPLSRALPRGQPVQQRCRLTNAPRYQRSGRSRRVPRLRARRVGNAPGPGHVRRGRDGAFRRGPRDGRKPVPARSGRAQDAQRSRCGRARSGSSIGPRSLSNPVNSSTRCTGLGPRTTTRLHRPRRARL